MCLSCARGRGRGRGRGMRWGMRICCFIDGWGVCRVFFCFCFCSVCVWLWCTSFVLRGGFIAMPLNSAESTPPQTWFTSLPTTNIIFSDTLPNRSRTQSWYLFNIIPSQHIGIGCCIDSRRLRRWCHSIMDLFLHPKSGDTPYGLEFFHRTLN